MSEYSRLVNEFFTRYEKPHIDELTIGFSGIDPPLKVLASEIDHEELNHLLGGDETGHYHLTKDQWEKVPSISTGESESESNQKVFNSSMRSFNKSRTLSSFVPS